MEDFALGGGPFVGEVEPGELAEAFEGFAVVGSGGFDLFTEQADMCGPFPDADGRLPRLELLDVRDGLDLDPVFL